MKKSILFIFLLFTTWLAEPSKADLLNASGKLTLLRVHEVGSGYGPSTDFIDVEVIVWLNTKPGKAFGFQLRNDNNRTARLGMLDILRDGFNHNWTVHIDYEIESGKNNGRIIRVWLTKPVTPVVQPPKTYTP
jgi:hypothetical protein